MKRYNHIVKYLYGLAMSLALLACGLSDKEIERMRIVKDVDLSRYAGRWYEIARFPHRFEQDLVGVTATYSLREDGKIDVLNEGFVKTLDGKHKKARAFAKVPDPGMPGRLKVYFFWPFGADYLILELDRDMYSYALVGSSSENYLWILSRTPILDEETYRMLVTKAADRGYDVSRLERVPQRDQ